MKKFAKSFVAGTLIVLMQLVYFAPMSAFATQNVLPLPTGDNCVITNHRFVSDGTAIAKSNNKPVVPAYSVPAHTAVIPGAIWVWPTEFTTDALNGENQTINRHFDLGDTVPVGGTIDIAVDNTYTLYLNGVLIGEDKDVDSPSTGEYNFTLEGQDTYTVPATHFKNGINTLTIEARNWKSSFTDPKVNPAGVMYAISVDTFDSPCGNIPVLTLTGDSVVELTVGSVFIDEGATAFDNEDGNITPDVVSDSASVDTSTAGIYIVTYNVQDSDGNFAIPVYRQVIVRPAKNDVCVVADLNFKSKPGVTQFVDPIDNVTIKPTVAPSKSGSPAMNLLRDKGAEQVWSAFLPVNHRKTETRTFLHTINVPLEPTNFIVDFAADNFTDVYVNDVLVHSDPRPYSYHNQIIVDITDKLNVGSNVIKFVATNLASSNINPKFNPGTLIYSIEGQQEICGINESPEITVTPDIKTTNPSGTDIIKHITIGVTANDPEEGDLTDDIVINYAQNLAERKQVASIMLENQLGFSSSQVDAIINSNPALVSVPLTSGQIDSLVTLAQSMIPTTPTHILTKIFTYISGGIEGFDPNTDTQAGYYGAWFTVSDSYGNEALPKARIVVSEGKTGNNPVASLKVCKLLLDENGMPINDSNIVTDFGIGLVYGTPNQALKDELQSSINNWGKKLTETPNFKVDLPFSPTHNILKDNPAKDAFCEVFEFKSTNTHIYYGEETANNGTIYVDGNSQFETPLYNDQVNGLSNFKLSEVYNYSPELFDNDTSNDSNRNINSDGHIVLTANRPHRTLVIVNQLKPKDTCEVVDFTFQSKPGVTKFIDPVDNTTIKPTVAPSPSSAATIRALKAKGAEMVWSAFLPVNHRKTETRTFLHTFTLNGTPGNTVIDFAADNYTDVYVNDVLVHSKPGPYTYHNPIVVDVTNELVTGNNVVKFVATNIGSSNPNPIFNPGVLIYSIEGQQEVCEANEIPVIYVNPEVVNITTGDSFDIMSGVSASDAEDGDLTSYIVTSGDIVDTNTAGTYMISYDVQDFDGQYAITKTRKVIVSDPAPVTGSLNVCLVLLDKDNNPINNPMTGDDFRISLTQSTTVNVDIETPAVINRDVISDINNEESVCINISSAPAGNHTYSEIKAIDDADDVIDYVKNLSAYSTTAYLETTQNSISLADFEAYGSSESSDGTLTVIGGETSFFYVFVKEAEHDQNQKPVITVDPDTITLTVGADSPDVLAGVSASDPEDGVINPANIVIGGDTVDTNTIGTYTVTYDVTDSASKPADQKTRTYIIQNGGGNGGPTDNIPVITVIGDNPLILFVGNDFVDPGATAADVEDGNITSNIIVGGDTVTTGQVKTFTITYNVSDSDGNNAVEKTRTVEVRSVGGGCNNCTPFTPTSTGGGSSIFNGIPVITLSGDSNIQLTIGENFTEPGYSANDNEDGDITANVVIGGDTVDTNTAGVYTITYNVTDSNGNQATEVTRTVTVGQVLGESTLTCQIQFNQWLKMGDRGEEVSKMQAWLNEKYNLNIKVDGIYGPETAAAVGYFQSRPEHIDIVLKPWNYNKPTFRWYKTTRMLANHLSGCDEGPQLIDDVNREWVTSTAFTGWVDEMPTRN